MRLAVFCVVFLSFSANHIFAADERLRTAGDLVVQKKDIGTTVRFFPYKVDGVNMEILAVKANDGSIRVAFNTCQICMGAPKAFFKQEGNAVVCQNCGTRFQMSMIEQQRGGCNPIPIMKSSRKDDNVAIVVPFELIRSNKKLFPLRWKKGV